MVYEYKCSECGKVIEKKYKMTENHPKVVKCPDCDTVSCYRYFGSSAMHIPYEWGSTDNKIKTHKKPSKRFY